MGAACNEPLLTIAKIPETWEEWRDSYPNDKSAPGNFSNIDFKEWYKAKNAPPPDPRAKPERKGKWDPKRWPPGPNEGDDSSTEDEFYGEAHMSNKFLPFVVENSTPTHMFKTLMSRSKGMNQVLIASIFHLILKVNIKTLRENVKELPDMPLEKVYEELLIKRPAYRVIDEVLADYQTIYKFFPAVTYWSDELKKYSAADAMLFFCSMAYAEKPIIDYTEYPYDLIKNREAQYEVLENIQEWVEFSDKGLLKSFANVTELRCFLLYHGLFRNIMEPDAELKPIKAVMTQVKL